MADKLGSSSYQKGDTGGAHGDYAVMSASQDEDPPHKEPDGDEGYDGKEPEKKPSFAARLAKGLSK